MNLITIKMFAAGAAIDEHRNFAGEYLIKLDKDLAISKNLPYKAWLHPDTKEVVEFYTCVFEESYLKKRKHEKYLNHWFYSEEDLNGSWIHHFNNESFIYPYQVRAYIREFIKH